MPRPGRLTAAQVAAIRADARHAKEVAKDYGVSYNTVYHIRAGRAYASVAVAA